MGFAQEDRQKVRRGVAVTMAGRVASIANALFLYVARYLIGGVAFGIFYVAQALITWCSAFFLAGFADTIMYFAARERATDEVRLYRVLATCFAWSIGIALITSVVINVFAAHAYFAIYGRHDAQVVELAQIMAWSLPLMAFVRMCIDSVKAHMEMKWAVLVNNVVRPIATMSIAIALAFAGLGAKAIAWGFVGGHLICVPVALYGYTRFFSVRRTLRALPAATQESELLRFALPQSVNMLFTTGLTQIDVLMLEYYVDSNTVGLYGLVSTWVRPIREVKRAFTGVFAPLVATYQRAENKAGITESLNLIVRWTASAGAPLALVLLAFYPEFVQQNVGQAWPLSRALPWLLALPPLLSAFFGLAGNLLLMTGHARMLLFNSSIAVVLNVGLNFLLIPIWGPLGAAVATAASGLCISVLQMLEMGRYEGITYQARTFLKPSLGLLLTAPAIVWATSEAGHAWFYAFGPLAGVSLKVALCLMSLVAYGAVIFGWPGTNPEREWAVQKLRRRNESPDTPT